MSKKLKKLKQKILRPFDNRKGLGLPQLVLIMLISAVIVSVLSWVLMLIMHARIESAAKTVCYNIVDGIAESGKLTTSMQTEFYKGFNNCKTYTGDYTVKYYKYSYAGGNFSKVLLGTSVNGSIVPEFTVPKDTNIQVVFSSSNEVPLDKVSRILTVGTAPSGAGLKVEAGGKVD